MKPLRAPSFTHDAAFALMEALIVMAIVIAVAAVVVPIVKVMKSHSNEAAALKVMKDLGSAAQNYFAGHDNELPGEDAPGPTTWAAAADPKNADVWFNALPRQMGRKGVGDYATNQAAFYTDDNVLHLPGAPFPTNDTRLFRPIFAIAFNRKLERRTADGDKVVHLGDIANPSRTVLLLEEGLPKEKRTVDTQPHYNGDAKASPRTFVGRHGGKGILTFVDGHTETVDPAETLDVTGQIVMPQTNFIWTKKAEENPNLGASSGG